MYCTKCDASLRDATGKCPRCGQPFDPANPDTYNRLRPWRVSVLALTVLRIVVLLVIALIAGVVLDAFLLPPMGGH